MLEARLLQQLQTHLQRIERPVALVATLDDSTLAQRLRGLLEQIAGLHPMISLSILRADIAQAEHSVMRVPSFSGGAGGETARVHFAGLPMGHEFTSLVLALLQAGGVAPRFDADLIDRARNLQGEHVFETFISLSCQNCPEVVQALNALAALNPGVRHTMIDGAGFQAEIKARNILAVPTVMLNGQVLAQGRMGLEDILAHLDTEGAARAAQSLSSRERFDVLVVGGGPAGAAASIYAARKGIRTGIVAERFGGQVQDTLGIENFISVQTTEGPKLVRELEAHVRQYGVDLMTGQRAAALIPASRPGEDLVLRLDSGAELRARSIVLATGARWRMLDVPGEERYRNRGVAYCPHCDGPLFKGQQVAVAGGGNSGVEAAIDLAGIVDQVTLLEFGDALRADAVLQERLASLPNVRVILQAQTTEVLGDGQRMTGLRYTDRASGLSHELTVAGVFVQIGLVPNTEWLKGTLALNARGEIEIDARGQTSLPGVFAAGDASTVPYKQIVIASGEGAKAALGAFDHLIRTPDLPEQRHRKAA
ncbi:MAG: alkyl hydroperoxide reductase subunit F [Burkholderiaceae bacterium]